MKAPLVVRVNGVVVRRVKVREFVWDGQPTGEQELIIYDPVLGSFPVDESFIFEVKYLSAESGCRCSPDGWQQVTLPELLNLLTTAHADQQAAAPDVAPGQAKENPGNLDTLLPPPPEGDPGD